MKKILAVIIVVIMMAGFVSASENVSSQQEINNKKYLAALDQNIIETMNSLTIFHNSAGTMSQIAGVETYERFLDEMAGECGSMRRNIRMADPLPPEEREIQIQFIIASIKPDVIYNVTKISNQQDKENIEYIKKFGAECLFAKQNLTKMIIEEEKKILNSRKISNEYLDLHSRHFLCSMMLNLIKPHHLLSRSNRDYLVTIMRDIEARLKMAREIEAEKKDK